MDKKENSVEMIREDDSILITKKKHVVPLNKREKTKHNQFKITEFKHLPMLLKSSISTKFMIYDFHPLQACG